MAYRLLFIPIFIIFWAKAAFAVHIVGGALRYAHVEGDEWHFELELFRDCSTSTPFDAQAPIAIYRDGVLFLSFLVDLDTVESLDLSMQQCPGVSASACIERGLYRFNKMLPLVNSTYVVAYQRCCLSPLFTNLVISNPPDKGLTINVALTPEAQQLHNSSPVWLAGVPRFLSCVHQLQGADLSATDPDGDALVYSFCSSLAGGGPLNVGPAVAECMGVTPNPPCPPPYEPLPIDTPEYSVLQPLGQSSFSQFNPDGGWLFRPEIIGNFFYAVCVQEFRNGVLLSESQRVLTQYVLDGSSATGEPETWPPLICAPNPALSTVTFSLRDFAGETVRLRAYDAAGRVVFDQNLPGGEETVWNVKTWPSGWYFLKAESGRHVALGRFAKE